MSPNKKLTASSWQTKIEWHIIVFFFPAVVAHLPPIVALLFFCQSILVHHMHSGQFFPIAKSVQASNCQMVPGLDARHCANPILAGQF